MCGMLPKSSMEPKSGQYRYQNSPYSTTAKPPVGCCNKMRGYQRGEESL